MVFHGPIGSANKLLKTRVLRDELMKTFGVKAAEMEAAGVADAAGCHHRRLFRRARTCDYCDEYRAIRGKATPRWSLRVRARAA